MLAPNFLAAAHYCYSVESRDMSGWMRVSEHNASFTNITGRRSFQMMRTRWLSAIPVSLDTAVLQRKSDHTQNKKNSIDAGGNMNVLCWNGACCIYMLYLVLVRCTVFCFKHIIDEKSGYFPCLCYLSKTC